MQYSKDFAFAVLSLALLAACGLGAAANLRAPTALSAEAIIAKANLAQRLADDPNNLASTCVGG